MRRRFVDVALCLAVCTATVALAQAQPINLSGYRGDSGEARTARGHCWDQVGVPKSMSPRNLAEADAIRACVDRVMAAFTPARGAPAAQSERGRCVQQLPGSVYNRETKRFYNFDGQSVSARCGPAS